MVICGSCLHLANTFLVKVETVIDYVDVSAPLGPIQSCQKVGYFLQFSAIHLRILPKQRLCLTLQNAEILVEEHVKNLPLVLTLNDCMLQLLIVNLVLLNGFLDVNEEQWTHITCQ